MVLPLLTQKESKQSDMNALVLLILSSSSTPRHLPQYPQV
jgi:hypothetical protein